MMTEVDPNSSVPMSRDTSSIQSKLSVVSRTEFDSQRGEKVTSVAGGSNDVICGEDGLQFDLDVIGEGGGGGERQKQTTTSSKPEPPAQLSPVREQLAEDAISTTSHPWLEQRARFYPAPILPNKPIKTGKVRSSLKL